MRDVGWTKKQDQNPSVVDWLDIWLSSGKDIDGLWVGTTEERQPTLRRVEDALDLIKRHSPLHYSRVVRNLKRVWVRLVPYADANGCYDRSLEACVLDPRFVLFETTMLEEIASAIVHEATHARLERWGISYDEGRRLRIEAICRRRELNFLAGLPNSKAYREQVADTLERCAADHDYFSDASFQQRERQGNVEALRYLGTPEWLVQAVLRAAAIRLVILRWVRRLAGPV